GLLVWIWLFWIWLARSEFRTRRAAIGLCVRQSFWDHSPRYRRTGLRPSRIGGGQAGEIWYRLTGWVGRHNPRKSSAIFCHISKLHRAGTRSAWRRQYSTRRPRLGARLLSRCVAFSRFAAHSAIHRIARPASSRRSDRPSRSRIPDLGACDRSVRRPDLRRCSRRLFERRVSDLARFASASNRSHRRSGRARVRSIGRKPLRARWKNGRGLRDSRGIRNTLRFAVHRTLGNSHGFRRPRRGTLQHSSLYREPL